MTASLHPELLSWAALIGRFTDFAKASLALPQTADGRRWRESVVPMITMQAMTFALSELSQVAPEERLFGWDQAEDACGVAAEGLDSIWGPEAPSAIIEAIDAAEAAIVGVLDRFTLTLISNRSEVWEMTPIDSIEPVDACLVAAPGTPIMPGVPIAWWSQVDLDQVRALPLPGELQLYQAPTQVWRHRDEYEKFSHDEVTGLSEEHDRALPLLVPRVLAGLPLSDPMPARAVVAKFHRSNMVADRIGTVWSMRP